MVHLHKSIPVAVNGECLAASLSEDTGLVGDCTLEPGKIIDVITVETNTCDPLTNLNLGTLVDK